MHRKLLLCILATGYLHNTVNGGQTLEHHLLGAPIDYVVQKVGWDVIVATVVEVSAHEATNGNPPRVKLNVHEVLRGDTKLSRERAVWRPIPHDIDNGPPEKDPRFKQWQAKPMETPKLGAKMILCGQVAAGERERRFYIAPVGHIEFSAKTRDLALKGIRAREAKTKMGETKE